MFETLAFSLGGTALFAVVGVGLVYLLAALGGGQRVRTGGGRSQGGNASGDKRPGRSAAQRAKR